MTEPRVRNFALHGKSIPAAGLRGVPWWGWALLALAAGRALLLPSFELVPQEAYYAFYARQPALSYFDHPPLLAWLLAGALGLFGHHALVLRAVPFLLTLFTQAAFVVLARR